MRIGWFLVALLWASSAFAQATLQQGGSTTQGRVPAYWSTGSQQPIVIDSGPAGGNTTGQGVSELNITARGTGTAPYASQGTGQQGTVFQIQDAVSTNSTGYHALSFSANAQGGGLISYNAFGGATALPLRFNLNGSYYSFPFSISGIVGPSTSVVNDFACWNNTTGNLLSDCGFGVSALATLAGNNVFTGLNTFNGGVTVNLSAALKSQTISSYPNLQNSVIPIEETATINGNADGSANFRMRREIVNLNGANDIALGYINYMGYNLEMTGGTLALYNGNHNFFWAQQAGTVTSASNFYSHFVNRRVNPGDPPATATIVEANNYEAGNASFIPQFTGDTGSITTANGLKIGVIGSQIAGKVGAVNGIRILDTVADNSVNGILIETTTSGPGVKKSINVTGGANPNIAAPSYFGSRTDMQLQTLGSVVYPLRLQNLGNNAGSGVGISFDVLATTTPATRDARIFAVNDTVSTGSFFSLHFQTVNGADPVDNLILNYDGTANIWTALSIGKQAPSTPTAALDITGGVKLTGSFVQTAGTITGDTPLANGTQTWNNSAVAFFPLFLNITPTAFLATSRFVDFRNTGVSKFNVDVSGNVTTASYIEGTEISTPAAPAANGFRLYGKDNGSGKTQVCAIFNTGAEQCFATQP